MMEQILNFVISPAHADPISGTAQQSGSLSFLVIFGVFFIFMYFAIWRPQSKRAKEQQAMLGAIAKGDEVITIGGLLGRVTKLNDQYMTLALNDTVEIVMQKSSVSTVLPKGTLKSIQ
jgi:preprotein translocase subunit YajC